jgi:hypothetical protein
MGIITGQALEDQTLGMSPKPKQMTSLNMRLEILDSSIKIRKLI